MGEYIDKDQNLSDICHLHVINKTTNVPNESLRQLFRDTQSAIYKKKKCTPPTIYSISISHFMPVVYAQSMNHI